ncbi:hypothetical protein MKX01_041567 [Papaver californicum]|nr:hypothetical protein MKX01_041567 [Papaver californicum]
MCERVGDSVTVHEIDAHNVVPLWVASGKLEYSAITIRSKIHKLLPQYLIDLPQLQIPNKKWVGISPLIDWEKLMDDVLRKEAEVPEIEWCEPGEVAAMEALLGTKNGFLSTTRLKNYNTDRNNPLKLRGLSGLSPYLHFGQISAQQCALEAWNVRSVKPQSVDSFMEELIARRELADNFCYYQPQYDSFQGAWEWARRTLMDHANDKRDIVGWLVSCKTADLYEIDGRDPNGYGWRERPVFGKIRYMNYAGCKRKFDIDGYIAYVKRLVGGIKKRKAEITISDEVKAKLKSDIVQDLVKGRTQENPSEIVPLSS